MSARAIAQEKRNKVLEKRSWFRVSAVLIAMISIVAVPPSQASLRPDPDQPNGILTPHPQGEVSGEEGTFGWSVQRVGSILQIAYGGGGDFPQFAALDLDSSYFRMINARSSGWGTSIILLPAFWVGASYYQSAPISASWQVIGDKLVISILGAIGGLSAQGTVSLSPPEAGSLSAAVTMAVTGQVTLPPRPGEAFKPVMLSSMHEGSSVWDAKSAFVGLREISLPTTGWIINPAVDGRHFGLIGGSSAWKSNAPTVELKLDRSLAITGWVKDSADPNDDNVGFWAASDQQLSDWTYTVTARTAYWWDGSTDSGDGWLWSNWLGYYNTSYEPWVYHPQHGWIYAVDDDATGVFFWDMGMSRWWWTMPDYYPWIYRYDAAPGWLWYYVGTSGPRWFYNWGNSSLESVP